MKTLFSRISLHALLSFTITCSPALCQQPDLIATVDAATRSTPISPVPTATPEFFRGNINALAYTLALGNFKTEGSDENRFKYIQAAENLLGSFCIRGLSPRHEESLKNDCDSTIASLAALDPANPYVICSKTDPFSQACKLAFHSIGVRELAGLANADSKSKDLDSVLAAIQSPPDRYEVENKLQTLLNTYLNQKTEQNAEAIEQFIAPYLQRTCQTIRISIPPAPPTAAPAPQPTATRNAVDTVLEKYSQPATKQAPGAQQFLPPTRFRLVSPACAGALYSLQASVPESYVTLCYIEGFTSPNCKLAIKRRKAVIAARGGSTSSLPGYSKKSDSIDEF